MKIEKMFNQKELVSNLRKAAKMSQIENLERLAGYIEANLNLTDLKHKMITESYEIELKEHGYNLIKIKSEFNAETNSWISLSREIINEMSLAEINSTYI